MSGELPRELAIVERILLLHHLPGAGGGLISRCLGAMQGTAVLHEINPGSVDRFDPVLQARLLGVLPEPSDSEHELAYKPTFSNALIRIAAAAKAQGRNLILRDWAHIDYIGFPFRPEPPFRLRLRDSVPKEIDAVSVAIVRDPIDQFLAMRRYAILKSHWDSRSVWHGMLRFAADIQGMPCFRYEDFLANPDAVLQEVCQVFGIAFDGSYVDRWWHAVANLPAVVDFKDREIREIESRRSVDDFLPEMLENADVLNTYRCLGYTLPDIFRRPRYQDLEAFQSPEQVSQLRAEADTALSARKFDQAVTCFRMLLEKFPNCRSSLLGISRCLIKLGLLCEATQHVQRILAANPNDIESLQLMVECLTLQERRFETLPYLRRLTKLRPENTGDLFQLSCVLAGVGAINESLTHCKQILKLEPKNHSNTANYLFYLNYSDTVAAADIAQEHRRVGEMFPSEQITIPLLDPQGRKLRIGYISSDFRRHPVGKIFSGLIAAHDHSRMEVITYRDNSSNDNVTEEIRNASDLMIDVFGQSNEELLTRIRNDQLDVLVDLGGFTRGATRIEIFARRAAPVQISFLGYPHTSGVASMDLRFTDKYADPEPAAEDFYVERLVRMESGILAWSPYPECKEIPLAPRNGPVILGSFNNITKISPSAIACWSKILQRCDDTIIAFKYGDRFQDLTVQERILRLFAENGTPSSRVWFLPFSQGTKAHLEALSSVDLALDSFPYQGTMTTLETLSVGTPIISLAGVYYAHRATSAMLLRLGLPELVVDTPAEYVDLACHLINDSTGLRALRSVILEQYYDSVIVRPEVFMREFESRLESLVAETVSQRRSSS